MRFDIGCFFTQKFINGGTELLYSVVCIDRFNYFSYFFLSVGRDHASVVILQLQERIITLKAAISIITVLVDSQNDNIIRILT